MRGALTRAAEVYNYVEVGIWWATGAVVAAMALRRRGTSRRRGLIAAITLFAFGLSDWAEIQTGGEWWRPWWLLAWKAVCVLVLRANLLSARKERIRGVGEHPPL